MDDEIKAELRFGADITGTLETSWSARGYEDLTLGIAVDLERARIAATNKSLIVTTRDGGVKEFHISALEDSSEFECGGKGYFPQDEEFVGCVLNKNTPTTDWKQSMDVQAMIDAIYKSARSGNEVFIGDAGNRN
jgi:predicted dehydrogenase